MYLQEAGFPVGFAWYLSGKIPQLHGLAGLTNLIAQSLKKYVLRIFGAKSRDPVNRGDEFARAIDRAEFTKRCFVLLGMGRDKPDGEVQLREDNQAVIKWNIHSSQEHFTRLRTQMKKIAEKIGGVFVDNPLTYLNKVVAVHPLGGCPMGDTAETGVVSPLGEVYGHPGLYVVDGSILPTSTGPNPSLTIAAIAEYIAEHIPTKSAILKKEKTLEI